MQRSIIGKIYHGHLESCSGIGLPEAANDKAEPVYHQYVVKLPKGTRNEIQNKLTEKGMGTLIHYLKAAHQMPAYKNKDWVGIDPDGLKETETILPNTIITNGAPFNKQQADKVGRYYPIYLKMNKVNINECELNIDIKGKNIGTKDIFQENIN